MPFRPAALAAAFLALAVPAGGQDSGRLALDDVRPGSAAVAHTVLRGTEIGTFDVEIVSVVRRIAPERDLILAKAVGEEIEHLGVAQGMSGSPVYVDGKLIGAVASTWSFQKEPLFGITPVEQMAREADWAFRHGSDAAAGAALLEGRAPRAPDTPGFRPIGSPLVLSGFDPRVTAVAADLFRPWGFTVTEGGAAGAGEGGPIEPGATLGVQLAGGDVRMAAFGTVTWVDGDRVHGWGHPLFQLGDVSMPLVGGTVHATVASNMISFKLASAGDVVGTLTSDRGSGISGRLGAAPPVTEFALAVERAGIRKDYRFDIVRNRYLSPSLVGLTAANSLLTRAGMRSEETVRFRQHIVLVDGRDTVVETLIAGDETIASIVKLLSEATKAIAANPFEDVEIARIDAQLAYDAGVRLGALTELAIDDDTPEPGGAITGRYTLRGYRGEETTHAFSVPIPRDAREGRYLLLAADARTAERYEAERDPRSFAPRTLDEYLERLRGLRQTDRIHLHLYRRSDGVLIDGRPLPDLPPSVLSVMRGAARSGVEADLPAELVHEERIPAGMFVVGAHDILLEVRKERP